MKTTRFIARRFLFGEKGASRFTGWIAIIGLTVGCLAMIVSVAVLNGFESRVKTKLSGIEGDLRVQPAAGTLELSALAPALKPLEEFLHWMPFYERKGLVMNARDEVRMVTFKAVDPARWVEFYELDVDVPVLEAEQVPVLVGSLLAQRLQLREGDRIYLSSPVDEPGGIGFPRLISGTVAGIFRVEVLDFDDQLVFIPLDTGRDLFLRKQGLDGVDLRFASGTDQAHLRQDLERRLPLDLRWTSWREIHQGLVGAMRLERIGAVVVLSMIILVAAFNLTSMLALVTFQKVREIGILRTLGMSAPAIRRIFITQGLIIGSVGATLGLFLGLALVLVQRWFGIIPLPEQIYFIDRLPMQLAWTDVALIPAIAFTLIFLAAYFASRKATLIHPSEAVRREK